MSKKSESVYASAPFKFLIEGNAFYIHKDLVSRHSYPLDRMMNGEMLEARQGSADLKDVDQRTFHRFIQWIYRGFYDPGKFSRQMPDNSSQNIDENDSQPLSLDLEPGVSPATTKRSKQGKKSKSGHKKMINSTTPEFASREELKESFIHRKPVVRREYINIRPPRPNQKPNEDYTEVFLSHAKLYVFADEYGIDKLKMLALDNLHNILSVYTLYEERTGDILALLRYSYNNTSDSVDGVEDLRTLLTTYVGYEMDTLMKDDGFPDLMIDQGGALLGDFMKMVRKRIDHDSSANGGVQGMIATESESTS